MNKSKSTLLALALIGFGMASKAHAQVQPGRAMYAVVGGTYLELGGFAGVLMGTLPNPYYAYLQLDVPATNDTVTLTAWSQDWQRTTWLLTNGLAAGDKIYFHYVTTHPFTSVPATNDYTVSVSGSSLALEGAMVSEPQCCDIPYFFGHSNVVAVSGPAVSAGILPTSPGELVLSWSSISNLEYQVQSRSGLPTGTWTNVGLPVFSDLGTCRVSDRLPPNERLRFYRVLVQQKAP